MSDESNERPEFLTSSDKKEVVLRAIEMIQEVATSALDAHGKANVGAGACPQYWAYREKRAQYIEGKVDRLVEYAENPAEIGELAVGFLALAARLQGGGIEEAADEVSNVTPLPKKRPAPKKRASSGR